MFIFPHMNSLTHMAFEMHSKPYTVLLNTEAPVEV